LLRAAGRVRNGAGEILIQLVKESQSCHYGSMKTTLDIPDRELRDVLRFTKAKTKREAVVTAVMEYNQRKRMAALRKHAGVSDTFMTAEELMKLRQMD
jgi:uncharacterized protein YbaA (DUF1428 family)